MRGLVADLRYGVSELLQAPRSGSGSAAWLLAGVLLGVALARWVDAPLTALPLPAARAGASPTRVPAARLLGRDAESRLRCLARHPTCVATPTPPPCAVPAPRPLES